MTTRHIANGQTYNLSYNAENQLVSVSGAASASFVYDGDGRLAQATFNNTTTLYVGTYYEKQGSTETKYYYAGSTRIAMRESATLTFLIGDHLGSTNLSTDSDGVLISELRYKPWGESRLPSGAMPTDYQFTGQRNIADIGLYFYNARFYDASLGRFTSADTIVPGGVQGLDRYAYTLNNPIRYTDPSGHFTCSNDINSDDYCPGNKTPWGGGNDGGSDDELILEEGDPDLCEVFGECDNDQSSNSQSSPSAVATMATVLDTAAMGMNGVYALVGDLIFLVCQGCYPAVVGFYGYFSYIPNTISTIAMGLWIMDGVSTGENNFTIVQDDRGTTTTLSLSQDTVIAVGTNLAGWTILKEPNIAFAVDAAVAGYDYGRLGTIPLVDTAIPAWINPTISYNTSTGFDFSWQQR